MGRRSALTEQLQVLHENCCQEERSRGAAKDYSPRRKPWERKTN